MIRVRRYRILLVAAVFSILAFYRFSLSQSLAELPLSRNGRFWPPARPTPGKPAADGPPPADSPPGAPSILNVDDLASSTSRFLGSTTSAHARTAAPETAKLVTRSTTEPELPALTVAPSLSTDKDGPTDTITSSLAAALTTSAAAGANADGPPDGNGQAPTPLTDHPPLRWTPLPEHFPVPTNSLIALPTGKPRNDIPAIQHKFTPETPEARQQREAKQNVVRDAFRETWQNYKKFAWMHDELRPVSGGFKDPFCSWAATLVDALDTLWILGFEEEFTEAVAAVGSIDFKTTPRKDLPVFETVIRYLGGLLAAHDVSGHKYPVLLAKAQELADVLMGAFDTPNRMPVTFYYWSPTFAKNPHRAGTRAVLAELGSLSMEFTRLAQLTKEPRYYDAVARITNELEVFQNKTLVPGLWPKLVDTSGCKKPPPPQAGDPIGPVGGVAGQVEKPLGGAEDPYVTPSTTGASLATPSVSDESKAQLQEAVETMSGKLTKSLDSGAGKPNHTNAERAPAPLVKRQLSNNDAIPGIVNGLAAAPEIDFGAASGDDTHPDPLIQNLPAPARIDCEPQGLAAPPNSNVQQYSFGGQADSTYEYLPKQYLLLGGLRPQYRTMYEAAIDAANARLLFRPMLPDADADADADARGPPPHVLGLGNLEAYAASPTDGTTPAPPRLQAEFAHLTCFAGGMWALGARIFSRDADLDRAAQLTDGCVWAYAAHPTGIMPETFDVLACERAPGVGGGEAACPWNQTRWEEALDPYRATREAQQAIAEENRQKALVESQRSAQMQAMTAKAAAWTEAERAAAARATDAAAPPPDAGLSVHDTPAVETASTSRVAGNLPTSGPIAKRQLGALEQDPAASPAGPVAEAATPGVALPQPPLAEEPKAGPDLPNPRTEAHAKPNTDGDEPPEYPTPGVEASDATATDAETALPTESQEPYNPFPSHEEYVRKRVTNERLAPGVVRITSHNYLLRPEAIESVFYMYRITGDEVWREKGWRMWQAIHTYTKAPYGYAALRDVTRTTGEGRLSDSMESFWPAETLKYFYLLFSPPSTISLDDWVLNTEAHPFKRPK